MEADYSLHQRMLGYGASRAPIPEEESNYTMSRKPTERFESEFNLNLQSPYLATQSQFDEPMTKPDFGSKDQKQPFYKPNVYLSIVVSGMPGQNINLIQHNIKIDKWDVETIIRSLDKYLDEQEMQLRKNIQKGVREDSTKGALQVHLDNGQYILDLMHRDAKPLLIFFTDSTNTLRKLGDMKRHQHMGLIDESIHRLHLSDARVISVDLQSDHNSSNVLGYINQESELHYITRITGGAHFSYDRLMEIDA